MSSWRRYARLLAGQPTWKVRPYISDIDATIYACCIMAVHPHAVSVSPAKAEMRTHEDAPTRVHTGRDG